MSDSFDKDWKWGHQTRQGTTARLLGSYTKFGKIYLVWAAKPYTDKPEEELLVVTQENGRYYENNYRSDFDVFNSPAPKKTYWQWYARFHDTGGLVPVNCAFETKYKAEELRPVCKLYTTLGPYPVEIEG